MSEQTTTKTISLIPHYGRTTEWMAGTMAEHNFDRGAYGVMANILQTFAAIVQKDPEEALIIIENLQRRADGKRPVPHKDQDDSLYEKED
jgi:hypothetical protein